MEACPNHPEADALYVEMLCDANFANLDAIDVHLWPSLVTRYEERMLILLTGYVCMVRS